MKTAREQSPTTGLAPNALAELKEANNNIHNNNKRYTLQEDLIAIKEERKSRDLRLRPLFLNVGMAVSILIAIVAMNWKVYDDGELVDLGQVEADVSEIIEIPISKQPPPPPPKQEVFRIEEVKDTEIVEELELNLDVEVTADQVVEEVEITTPIEIEEEVDEVFMVVEEEPAPIGGIEAFYEYLNEELKYPMGATRLGVQGMVFVRFIIEKDGSITDVEVVKGIGAGCDEEAIRVIENAPPWKPGKQRGKPVRVRKVIPVRFILQK